MTDKKAGSARVHLGTAIAEAILSLPRGSKRTVMVVADAIAIPTALWAALALKFDRLDPALDRTFAYFLVALASALFFFAVLGLYRAVIRFMGPKAMVTVITGVSLSVVVLALFDRLVASHQIPLSAFGDLLGAGAAVRRRQPLHRALPVPARHGCQAQVRGPRGDLWRGRCRGARLFGAARRPGLPAGGVHRRQEVAAGQQHQRHPGVRPRVARRSWCASSASIGFCSPCRRPRGGGAARS